jgi:uncharacterized membrane protein
MDLDLDKISRSPFAIGALGSIVALKFAPGASWAERVFNVLAGAACAGYASPAAAEWLHVTSAGMQSGLSFGVGMFGLSLAAAAIEGIRALKASEILDSWLRRGK